MVRCDSRALRLGATGSLWGVRVLREIVVDVGGIDWRRSMLEAVFVTVRVRLLVSERVGIGNDCWGCMFSPRPCVGLEG